jgi:PadR family transcriptional regulator PadR
MKSRTEASRPSLPRGYPQACLLLLLAEGPAHGYDLADQLHALGLAGLDTGALYRALRVMEQEGLVESWWEESSAGPARRTYWLTELGAASLQTWAAKISETSNHLSMFLHRHGEVAKELVASR